jgi:hypothetical protein
MDLPTDILCVIRGFLPDSLNICLVSKSFSEERTQAGRIQTNLNIPELNLEWAKVEILQKSPLVRYPYVRDLLKASVFQKNLSFAKKLVEEAPFILEAAVSFACTYGFLELLQATYRFGERKPRCNLPELELAASHGHLELVKWLNEQGQSCTGVNALHEAAKNGHMETVQWLVDHGAAWSDYTISLAIMSCRLDIVQYLRQRGCPWSVDTTKIAIRHGTLKILQWVVENQCPWSDGSTAEAVYYGHKNPEIVVWVFRRMGESGSLFKESSAEHLEIERNVRKAETQSEAVEVFLGAVRDGWYS